MTPHDPGERGIAVSDDAVASRARIGWLLLLGLILCGWLLLWRAAEHGAPTWLAGGFLALGAAGLLAFFLLVDRHQAALVRGLRQRETQRLGGGLAAAFAELRAGDMVRGLEQARALPDRLARGYEAAAHALTALAQQIQDRSLAVASTSDEVDQVASDLAAGASQQAASVVEITAAMEELAQTATQIAESAARQAALAERAEASGVGGAAAVDQAVAGVAEVQKRIQRITSRADTLGTRSKEIFRVLDLITEIAQETHILSLNAAIEAAAAGDRGRRFSVVADEVRRLAQRARESVESVRGMVEEFAGAIRATVVATEEGGKEAARVLDGARAATDALAELRESATQTARVARQISLVTQQQQSASGEVVTTLRDLNQVVQRMSRDLHQLTDNAKRLNKTGLGIQLLAQAFHLDSPRSLKHLAQEWLGKIEAAGEEQAEAVLDNLIQGSRFVELGYYVDPRGYALALSCNRSLLSGRQILTTDEVRKVDLRQRPWYRAALREGRPTVTPPHTSLLSGEPCLTVAAPRFAADGSLQAILGLDVNLGGWTKI